MRRYELMLLLRPDLEDDKLQSAVEKVTRAIVNAGGSLAKVSPWGKRRLAYEIKHHRDASYFLIHFDIEPTEIRPLEQSLMISEEILRHLVTVIEERSADEAEAIKTTPAAAPADGSDDYDDEANAEAAAAARAIDDAPMAAEDAPDAEGTPEAIDAESTATPVTDSPDEAERSPAETTA
jgi:small subunit ribosomal protein S6